MKKLLTSIFLGIILVLSSIVPTSASTLEHSFVKHSFTESANVLGGTVDLREPSDNTIISDVMTFDELIQTISKDYGISVNQAKENILADYKERSLSRSSNTELMAELQAATYRVLAYEIVVKEFGSFKPMVRWYTRTSEWGNYWGIVEILDTTLVRASNNISKQFSGTLYTNLENAYTIFFRLNGDFYNNGTTTVSGNVGIKVGESATLGFSISNSSNWFGYLFKETRLAFQR